MADTATSIETVPSPAPGSAALPASSDVFASLLDACPDGVVICDARAPDMPAVYVNRAFEQLTGYCAAEVIGHNMRFLQGADRDQEGLLRIRLALKEGVMVHATLRNYRKDGTLFWNDIKLVPLRDSAGEVAHFASFHHEAIERLRPEVRPESRNESRESFLTTQTMLAYLRDDKLTGLLRRGYFDELVRRDLGIAQRESRPLSLFLFDPDFFDAYRDLFGQTGADQSLRRIGRTIGGCFRRASDLCARFDAVRVAALCSGMQPDQAAHHAETVVARVRDLAIHHPRSAVSRYLTLSVGLVTLVPSRELDCSQLVASAEAALDAARAEGHNRIVSR